MSKKVKSGALDRAALLSLLTTKIFRKEVAGLGTVFFRELSALERLNMLRDNTPDDPMTNFRLMASALLTSLSDETGAPLLSAEDLEQLMNGTGTLVQELITCMLEVNGITKAAAEELEGNS